MRSLLVLALLAGCSPTEDDGLGFPINPGGGGPGTPFVPDAAVPPSDVSSTITGRVCLIVVDAQTVAMCEPTGAAGLVVTLGSQTAVTSDDGSFTIMRPTSTNGLVWSVTGTGIKPSAIRFGTVTTLPAINEAAYNEMVASLNAPIDGTGAVIVRVTRTGSAVQGATVTTQPASDSGIFYDGPSPTEWEQDATGPNGVAWAPSIATGTASVTVSEGGTDTTFGAQPIFADTITFVFAQIP